MFGWCVCQVEKLLELCLPESFSAVVSPLMVTLTDWDGDARLPCVIDCDMCATE